MKAWIRFAAVALVAIVSLVWWYAPNRVIERRTRALLEVITVPPSSGKAARLMRPDSLAPFLGDTVRFQTPANEVNGDLNRPEITAGFGHVAANSTETRFQMLEKRSIEVIGDTAVIRFLLDAHVDLPGHHAFDGTHETRIEWHKTNDSWRVAAVEVVPTGTPLVTP